MLDAFKQLVESGVMTEETKNVVEAAFAAKIQENRDQVPLNFVKNSHKNTIMTRLLWLKRLTRC